MAAGDTSCSEPSAPEKPSVPAPSAMRESPCPANQKMCGCHSRRAWRRSEKEPPASGGGEARSSPAAMSALASGLQSRGATSGEQNMKSARRPSGSVARLIGDCRGSRLDVACAAEVAAGAPVPGAVPPNVGGGAAAAADGTLDGEAAAAVVRAVEIPVGEVTPSAVAVSVDSCVSLVAHVWPVAWTGLPSQNAAVTAAIRPPSDPCTNGRAGTAVAGAAGAARRGQCGAASAVAAAMMASASKGTLLLPLAVPPPPAASLAAAAEAAASTAAVLAEAGSDSARTTGGGALPGKDRPRAAAAGAGGAADRLPAGRRSAAAAGAPGASVSAAAAGCAAGAGVSAASSMRLYAVRRRRMGASASARMRAHRSCSSLTIRALSSAPSGAGGSSSSSYGSSPVASSSLLGSARAVSET
mmetsp:Transcript_27407/g.87102  ORF Transcript_27407/g.87102 Transcript_27407/m.87102 type:complete len:414 (+) Transcript_27407:2781-4022(+)